MHDAHVVDMAELYALGALTPEEQAEIDAHIAHCSECLRAVGSAEEMVAKLDDLTIPLVEPPASLGRRIAAITNAPVPFARPRKAFFSAPPGWLAAAASVAFVLGIGGGVAYDRIATPVPEDNAALATLATSHFLHANFTARDPSAPPAKVIYARDGSWLYVIVDAGQCDCRIEAVRGGSHVELGSPRSHGTTATLWVPKAGRPAALALVSDTNHTVADVPLKYSAAP
jgi:hypothetical protein